MRLGLSGGGFLDLLDPHAVGDTGNGSALFFGFTDRLDTYTSITLCNSDPGHDYFGFDDFIVATPVSVPEPTTLSLLAAGLFGIEATRRRRVSRSHT